MATPAADRAILAADELEALRRENRELRLADATRSVLGNRLADPLDLLKYVDDVDQFIADRWRCDARGGRSTRADYSPKRECVAHCQASRP